MIVIRHLFLISTEVQTLLLVEFKYCVPTESHRTFHIMMILLAIK